MLHALYLVIIYPLYQIVEFSYELFNSVFGNTGVAVIGVSLAITLLCLPLYAVAEKWQQLERDTQANLKKGIQRIKTTFSGDEQYMMLTTFYKENHYHPMMALRSSFGLLIQIPFFIAAYNFLSNNPALIGKSFLFIKDMGNPDKMFTVAGFAINVLPIAMTIINIAAGAIYTKGFSLKEKVQIYGMALVFLVILYNSPSGLVLYWTMNNVFSLIKNIFYKLKNPLKVFHILCCSLLTLCIIYLFIKKFDRIAIFIILDILLILLPFAIKCFVPFFVKLFEPYSQNQKQSFALFFMSILSLAILCGIVIPSLLMTSSTAEFCYIDSYSNPIYFLFNSFMQALGLFAFWPICLYFLFGKKTKVVFAVGAFTFLILGLINNFAFQGNYGTILPEIEFTEHKSFFPSKKEFILNVLAMLVAISFIFILLKNQLKKTVSALSSVTLIVMISLSIVNIIQIQIFFSKYERPSAQLSQTDKCINLSKTKKNVLVIMMDRSTGYIIKPVFDAKPELYSQFKGFTLYPNTVSFGSWTIQGADCLYGGYEYIPWEMNHRRELTMVEKHNEAISLQARIFAENGYKVTVLDPPYPNYDVPPIFKAYENIPNTCAYETIGKYSRLWYEENGITPAPIRSNLIKRNHIWFSILKISPMILRPIVHYHDFWMPKDSGNQQSISDFIDNYAVLNYLPELTNLENNENCFVIMDNEIAHTQVFTQYPDYTPSLTVTNTGNGFWNSKKEFHVNMAGYTLLGKYMDYLRQNNVYDNTRIIIVADHGASTRCKDIFDESIGPRMFEYFNPVLMVKDFDDNSDFSFDDTFMTHADVPAFAFDAVINNPVNPFTGKAIKKLSQDEKNERCVISFSGANAVNTSVNNGFRIKDSDWYTVHDSIFKSANWKHKMPEYKAH